MATIGEHPRSALLPPTKSGDAPMFILKMTDSEVDNLMKHGEALTFTVNQKTGKATITVNEDNMNFSLHAEDKKRYELYNRKGNRCQRVGFVGGVMEVSNRQLSDKYRQKVLKRTQVEEERKRSRQLVSVSNDQVKGSNKLKKRFAKNGRLTINGLRQKTAGPRLANPQIPKRPRVSSSSLNGSAVSSDRSLPKATPAPPVSRPKPIVPTPAQPKPLSKPSTKPKISSSRHATPSPNVSRSQSPEVTSPKQPKEDPAVVAKRLRTSIMHTLALGRLTTKTLNEKLPEFNYEDKAKVVQKVGQYTGSGYVLSDALWDEIDPDWPGYSAEDGVRVEEALMKRFMDIRTKEVLEQLQSPPPERKTMTEAFTKAWKRWGSQKEYTPRPEITSEEMDDEYRNFYNHWLPYHQAIADQVDILLHYFKKYSDVYETLEYRFEYEAAEKKIQEIAKTWSSRRDQALVLMEAMNRELRDVQRQIERWEEQCQSG